MSIPFATASSEHEAQLHYINTFCPNCMTFGMHTGTIRSCLYYTFILIEAV